MIVIDASLAAKLVIQEQDTTEARAWFGGLTDEVVAPDLIAIEVSQAIVRRVNAKDASPSAGRAALRQWYAILQGDGIRALPTTVSQIETAAELAMALGHPVTDCVYLAIAIGHGCALVTSDAKFAKKAHAVHSQTKLLADLAAD